MQHLTPPDSLNGHPAMRVLVLAWAAAAAQTPIAAWAWVSCFALGLMAARIGTRSEAELPPALALRELPTPQRPPARRRTDTQSATRPDTPPALPMLKAHHDALTGLATPQQLGDTGEAWSQDLQARGLALCVLHVGLEGLEPVIERYGQEAGDQVLQQVAKRLRHLARDEDRVMRFDGAEFVLLLACPRAESHTFSRNMTTRIGSELQRPLAYRTVSKLHITCDVGVALWPLHGDTLEAVIEHASGALAATRTRRHAALQHEAA